MKAGIGQSGHRDQQLSGQIGKGGVGLVHSFHNWVWALRDQAMRATRSPQTRARRKFVTFHFIAKFLAHIE